MSSCIQTNPYILNARSFPCQVFSLLAGARVDLRSDQKCPKEVWIMTAGYLHHVLPACVTPSHMAFCSTGCTASFLSNSPLKLWIPSIPDILDTAKLMPTFSSAVACVIQSCGLSPLLGQGTRSIPSSPAWHSPALGRLPGLERWAQLHTDPVRKSASQLI